MSKTPKTLISSAVLAVALATAGAVILTPFASGAAHAQGNSGGRGNSDDRGRGNDGESRADARSGASAASEGRGRGALASELKGLNAANASPQALANASPDSMPGRLAAFKNEYQAVYDATVAFTDATQALTDYPAFSTEFEEGTPEYIAASELYQTELGRLQTAVTDAELALIAQDADYTESYTALTGGVQLSAQAEDELMRLLGLR